MIKKLFAFLFLLLFCFKGNSQFSLPDSTNYKNLTNSVWQLQNWTGDAAPELKAGIPFVKQNNDWKFILALLLVILYAVFKILYPKYLADLFGLIYKSNIKSTQIKDQLESNLLPSILLNIYFTILFGVFSYLVIQHYQPGVVDHKNLLIISCITFVGIIYLVKFIGITFFGWLFSVKETASSYMFTVFFFNKILGIVLLPFIVYLLLNNTYSNSIILVSLFIISLLILYRYIFSYISLKKKSHLHPFHFFLYLCLLEIMPLALIYKGIMVNYSKFL